MKHAHRRTVALISLAAITMVAAAPQSGCRPRLRGASYAAGSASRPSRPSTDWDKNDKQLQDAVQRARLSVDTFTARLANPKSGDEGFSVLIDVQENGSTEHFWLEDIEYDGIDFIGTITERGEIIRSVRPGERIRKSRRDIKDWMYITGGKVVGAETTRVFRDRMSQKERADFDRESGVKFD